jgi:hypothetical protein
MTSSVFSYQKAKVIQALRYHFITRKEIKILIILVNVFALASAVLFFIKRISPVAFMTGSIVWFMIMLAFWFMLPYSIYKRSKTFLDSFKATLDTDMTIENERGKKTWQWKEFSSFMESPHFFHLYFDARSFFLIPKSAFEGDDVHEARRIFKEKISS